METLSKILWVLVVILILIIAVKIVPIYHKAYSMRKLCQDYVDRQHRYGSEYITTRLNEEFDRIGIPKNQRDHKITVTEDAIILEIFYEDNANFFDYYDRDFKFYHQCEGVTESVVQ